MTQEQSHQQAVAFRACIRHTYRELLALVEDRSVALEEFARQMILAEEGHAAEVDRMLRKPGELSAFAARPV